MLIGTCVRLRPVSAADLRQLRVWEGSPDVARGLATTASMLDARESAEQEFDRILRTPRIKLLAIETLDHELAGMLRLHDVDLVHRKAQVRLFIAPEFQGRGLGTDALKLAVRFCFAELGLHRLGLVVRADHVHARHIYEHVGFEVEGCERDAVWSAGTWVDFVHMGLLADRWWLSADGETDTADTVETMDVGSGAHE